MADSFETWVARIRKDPLGPQGLNQLGSGYKWNEQNFNREHILLTGEHNAPEIPREVGSIDYSGGGGTIAKKDFRHATAVSNPATGQQRLTVPATAYPAGYIQTSMQVQNCSETGSSVPCIAHAIFTSGTQVDVYTQKLNNALGAGNTWAVENSPVSLALHGQPIPYGQSAAEMSMKVRGDFLTDESAQWNAHVAADAGLRKAFLVEHQTSGIHKNREYAISYGHVTWDGATERVVGGGRNSPASVLRVSQGRYTVTLTSAVTLSMQVFLSVDYARTNGGTDSEIWVACTPYSAITTTTFGVWLYTFNTGTNQWARGDTDFFFVAHAGYP